MEDKMIEVYNEMMGIDIHIFFDEITRKTGHIVLVYEMGCDYLELVLNKKLNFNIKKFIYDNIPYVNKIELFNDNSITINFQEGIYIIYKLGDKYFNI